MAIFKSVVSQLSGFQQFHLHDDFEHFWHIFCAYALKPFFVPTHNGGLLNAQNSVQNTEKVNMEIFSSH